MEQSAELQRFKVLTLRRTLTVDFMVGGFQSYCAIFADP